MSMSKPKFNKNKFFRQLHIYVSLFFLPLALLYALTGISYILDYEQDSGLKTQTYTFEMALEPGKEQEIFNELLRSRA